MPEAVKQPGFIVGAALFIAGAAVPGTNPQLMMAGAGLMMAEVTAKKPELPGSVDDLLAASVTVRDPLASHKLIYGAPRVGGAVTFLGLSGDTNEYLNLVVTLAGTHIESIDNLYLNDEMVPLDGNGDATGRYAGAVHAEFATGDSNQAALGNLTDQTRPSWVSGGAGVRLNGGGQYVSIGSTALLNPSTLRLIFYLAPRELSAQTVLSFDGGNGWKVTINGDGDLTLSDAAGNSVTASGLAQANLKDQWKIEADGSGMTIYREDFDADGVSLGFVSKATTGTAYDYSGGGAGVLLMGSLDGSAADATFLNGVLDDMRVYEHSSGTLAGSWLFSEGSGTTSADGSGNGLTATLEPAWRTTSRQRGRAYAWVRLTYDADLFSGGLPNLTFGAQGRRVLDPRTADTVESVSTGGDTLTLTGHGLSAGDHVQLATTDTLPAPLETDVLYHVVNPTADTLQLAEEPGGSAIDITDTGSGTHTLYPRVYSNNPALCLADYLLLHTRLLDGTLTRAKVGLGADLADLDLDLLSAAANVCDESVSLAAGGSETRYTCDGMVDTAKAPQAIVEELLSAMGGQLAWVEGLWGLYAAAWRASVVSLTEDDLAGPDKVQSLVAGRDSFNAVKGVFVDPDNDWQPSDYPPVTSSTYGTADGERVYGELNLPYTKSHTMAQRLAKIVLERARREITYTATFKTAALEARPPETVDMTLADYGWSGKTFELRSGRMALNGGADGAPVLVYEAVCRESDANVYAWTPGTDEQALPAAPRTALPSALSVAAPENLALASGTAQLYTRLDGTIFSRIKVSWDAVNDRFVVQGGRIEVEYKKSADSTWLRHSRLFGDATETYILDVQDGTAYDVRVRAVNAAGTASSWVSATNHAVVGKTAAPSDVTGLTAVQTGDAQVMIDWDDVTDADLGKYEVRVQQQGTPVWDTAQPIARVKGNSYAKVNLSPGSYTLLCKALDTSGNYSDTAASVNLTVTATTQTVSDITEDLSTDGTLSHFVRHHTGVLVPDNQDLASALSDAELWDEYVHNPYDTSVYTADAITLAEAAEVLLSAELAATLGPAESGSIAWSVEVDLDSGGWQAFVPGLYTCTTYQFRFTADNTADALGVYTGFSHISQQPKREVTGSLTAAAGGTAVALSGWLTTPEIDMWAQDDGWGWRDGASRTGFTAHHSSDGASDDGGPVAWRARNY